ncbi:uncharacterized protein Haspin [Palaemon carinicauda]|uniref:uncharacterized protein Haspin n=1 Tax=Palaemon carinicauda TaxID=392227 RepID=UPI0035B58990
MGRHRHITGTYSKVRKNEVTEDERRKRYRERKPIPDFDSLFVQKVKTKEDSNDDPFDCLVDNKKLPDILEESDKISNSKSIQRRLCVNNVLTNSTFGSIGHSSANDTFDNLVKINRLPVRTVQKVTEILSSSSSSVDTTGILYQSLKSCTRSFMHSSAFENSKLQSIKKDTDSIKRPKDRPIVNFEANKENKVFNNRYIKIDRNNDVSPKLFSSGKDVENKTSGTNIKTDGHSLPLFSSEDELADKNTKVHRKRGRPKIIREQKSVECDEGWKGSDKIASSSDFSDGSEKMETSNSNLDAKKIHCRRGLSVFKKPGITVEKAEEQPVVNFESNKEDKVFNNRYIKNNRNNGVSPELFSSDKDVENKTSGTNIKTDGHSLHLFSSEDELADKNTKVHRKRGRPKINRGKKSVECDERWKGSDKIASSSDFSDGSEKKETSNSNLDAKEIHCRMGLSVFKKPNIAVGKVNSVVHPSMESHYGIPCSSSPNNIEGFLGTPVNKNFAKVFLNGQFLSSQKLTPGSQFSNGSQGSGKSSGRSAVTSTPVDTSRIRSFDDSLNLWNADGTRLISPVPREDFKLSRESSPVVFEDSLAGHMQTLSLKSKKSLDNPSTGSDYHTCVSNGCVSSNCAKSVPCSLEGEGDKKRKSASSNNEFNIKPSHFKKNSSKNVCIPEFDPSGELHPISSSDQSVNTNYDGSPSLSAQMPLDAVPKDKLVPDRVSSDNSVIQEVSRNISSNREREINSFLNHPGIGLSLRTRKQKRKYSKNKVEPLPIVKRLTRQSRHISKMKKSYAEKSCIQSENGNTDHSTTTEPSFSKPWNRQPNIRKRKSSLRKIQPSFALQCSTRRMSRLRKEAIDSSGDSLASSKENFVLDTSATKPLVVVIRKRTSLRLANKRGESQQFRFIDDSMSSKSVDKEFVCTRPSARKLRETKKKLSIMQFSLSSVKSRNSDFDESKFSIASKNTVSEKDSIYSVHYTKELSECEDIEEESKNFRESSVVLNNLLEDQIKEESKEDDMMQDNISETSDINETKKSVTAQKHPVDMSFNNNCDLSRCDIGLDEVFNDEMKIAMLNKRGKGWIRSLSVARASLYGSEQLGDSRRKTVHRMSIGRRTITHLNTTGFEPSRSFIEEEEDECTSQIDFLSQSVLEDPQRHVLALCSQTEPLPMTDCFTESRLSCCKKIGEGVYGEVFMTKPNPDNMDGATVLKLMPIEGDFEVNGEPQKRFSEIISEIIISLELSNLQSSKEEKDNWTENFVHVLNCWCVKGSYHKDMLRLWDLFHEEKGSENDRPDIFPDTQLHIVLEFTHGGRDLEGFVFNNAQQAHAIFLQIAYTLAVAEQSLEFEHRDLHWGNVLIATTTKNYAEFKLNGALYSLETKGVMATVIDFTLSRLKMPNCVMYNNLAEDPSLFTAEGDYQFEIYRQMKKVNRNNWEDFTPYTNVLWLHYIVDKMINECYYKNTKARIHRSGIAMLRKLKDTILDSESATAFVLRRECGI